MTNKLNDSQQKPNIIMHSIDADKSYSLKKRSSISNKNT